MPACGDHLRETFSSASFAVSCTPDAMSLLPPDHASDDPFARLAAESGVSLQLEALYRAPYDALEPPAELERTFLVALTEGRSSEQGAMRLVFLSPPDPAGDAEEDGEARPTIRDVLWWLAADAWAIEHARSDLVRWAAHHGFDANSRATRLRFDQLRRQATALRTLFGVSNYTRLLDLYVEAVGGRGPKQGSTA